MNTLELRKASKAVYLATEESVARDLSIRLRWAADEIDKLREEIANTPLEPTCESSAKTGIERGGSV